MTNSDRYKAELLYIDKFWDKVTIRPKRREKLLNVILKKTTERMHKNIINIPKSFIIPNLTDTNAGKNNRPGWFAHIFYWDTFFMFRGLIRTRHEWLLRSMVDNFTYLYEHYGIVPNFNSPASIGRSQPPFLTSMILDTYNHYYYALESKHALKKLVHDLKYYKKWLKASSEIAKKEYNQVWKDPKGFFHHSIQGSNLSHYGDRDIGFAHSAELESGWDFTSRFYNRCNEYLPVDLNVLLFKYERDFVKIADILSDTTDQKYWTNQAHLRREEVNNLMWNDEKGFFFDYNYVEKKQSDFLSLAGFTPLWAGLATPEQARKMVKILPKFETDHGLVITAKESLSPSVNLKKIPVRYRAAIEDVIKPKQWDYPNIWPPLEYLTVIGLLKYGFTNDAIRIMKKSLKTQSEIFKSKGTFFEKINGVTGNLSANYHYAGQSGFGWTNAVFYRYVQILDAIEQGIDIYSKPKSKNAPFKLSIPH